MTGERGRRSVTLEEGSFDRRDANRPDCRSSISRRIIFQQPTSRTRGKTIGRHRLTTYVKLLAAGWRPNRNVWSSLKLPVGLQAFPEAERVLTEYGGLRFERDSEIALLEPSIDDLITDEIVRYEKTIGRRLYPLGFFEHQDRHYLLVDDRGIIYTLILIDDPEPFVSSELEPLASSFEQAIEYLVRGTVAQSEMSEDLRSVGMLGKIWESRSRGGEMDRESMA